jgi:hypothetical protein
MQPPIPLDMQINFDATSFNNIRMARMPSGKIMIIGRPYQAGPPPYNYQLYVGGQPITKAIFASLFTPTGNLIWTRENKFADAGIFSYRPVYANAKFYFGGGTRPYDTINTYIPVNNLSSLPYAVDFAIVYDTLGNLVWGSNSSTDATGGESAVTVVNNKLYVGGSYVRAFKWGNNSLYNPSNSGKKLYITELDITNGNNLRIDTIKGTFGYDDNGKCLIADNRGNVYLGGSIGGTVTINNQTITSSGGTSDFFIAKFGTANCSNVVPITLQHFTAKQKNNQQVLCSWQSLQEINGSHYIVQRGTTPTQFTNIATITAAGKPNVYAYTDTINTTALQGAKNLFYRLVMVEKDGTFQYSNIAAINLTQYQQIQVYPNPANNHVMLILPYPTQKVEPVQLYNLQGTLVLQTHLNAFTQILNIPIQTLPKATYLIKVKGFATAVVVKE